jgi:hypothetical protein
LVRRLPRPSCRKNVPCCLRVDFGIATTLILAALSGMIARLVVLAIVAMSVTALADDAALRKAIIGTWRNGDFVVTYKVPERGVRTSFVGNIETSEWAITRKPLPRKNSICVSQSSADSGLFKESLPRRSERRPLSTSRNCESKQSGASSSSRP